MKRTAILRKTALRPGLPPRRYRPLRREGSRGRARRLAWSLVTRQAIEAAQGVCQIRIEGVCIGRPTEGHHRRSRAQGGADTLSNCAAVCRECHRYLTQHPAEAYASGWTLRRNGGADV